MPPTTAVVFPRPGAGVARLELLAMCATAVGHLACHGHQDVRPFFLALAVGGWVSYGVVMAWRDPEVLARWGFSRQGLVPATRWTAGLVVAAAVAMAAIGAALGQLTFPPQLLAVLLLYPLWGWVQQWMVQGVLVRALEGRAHPAVVTVLAALAFGLVHWPYPALMAATFGLGLVVTPMYLRWRNLWPLGVAHGWLGALLYYWVLGRDPWMEMVGGLL